MIKLIPMNDGVSSEDGLPVYVLDDGKLRRTIHHALGWSELPDYELRENGKIYRTDHHLQGAGVDPDYEFRRDGCMYRTDTHPGGQQVHPEFRIAE
jgi:hypothetical protein